MAALGSLFNYPITNPLSPGPTPAVGQILSGCSLVFYLSTTTTATPVFSDGALTVSLGNTVNANASGQFVPLYLNPNVLYRVQLWSLANGTGVKLQDIDPYGSAGAVSFLQMTLGTGLTGGTPLTINVNPPTPGGTNTIMETGNFNDFLVSTMQNLNTAGVSSACLQRMGDGTNFGVFIFQGQNFTPAAMTGGPTGLAFFIDTNGPFPFSIGTNQTERVRWDGTTGAATFRTAIGVNGVAPPAQVTGWGTPTGAAVVANFPGASATLVQTSTAVAELIAALKALGLFGV